MLTIREIERHFDYLPEDTLNILLEIRNLVGRIAPDATEVIHRSGISYYHSDRGGPVSAGICQILTHEDYVEIGFVHGAFLPDPTGLLQGDRKAKRFVRVDSYDLAPWLELEKLIEAHNLFDPYTQSFLPTDKNTTNGKARRK